MSAESGDETTQQLARALRGLRLMCRAVRDHDLDRGCLRILAHLIESVDPKTGTAYPSHERMAADEVMASKTVNNKLHLLRTGDYIRWEDRPNPLRPPLTTRHYWVTEQITEAVAELKTTIDAKLGQQLGCPAGRATEEEFALPGGQIPPDFALPGGHRNRLSLSKESGGVSDDTTRRDVPHMNGVGFVISAKDGLHIPTDVVEDWRIRFPDIPDLEAKLQKLSGYIRHKGVGHPGWSDPESWMVDCLAQDNAVAKQRKRTPSRQTPQETEQDRRDRITMGDEAFERYKAAQQARQAGSNA